MFHEIIHSADDLVSSDGAWWILGLNGILFIPAIFAFFFYPMAMLMGVGAVAALMVAGLVLRWVMARRAS
jgi:hypothetical protein